MSSHTPTNSDDEALSGRKVAEPLPVCPRCGSALIDQQERPGDLADDPDTVVWTQYECDSWWPDNDPSGDYSDSACELIRSLREELAEEKKRHGGTLAELDHQYSVNDWLRNAINE